MSRKLQEEKKPDFPDSELKQVIIRAVYHPNNPDKLKEIEEEYRERGRLKPGEILTEKYPEWLHVGKEKFIYTNAEYCYNEVKIEDRERKYKDHLRVRIYDTEGKLMTEDFLRLAYPYKYDEEHRYTEEYFRRHYYIHNDDIILTPEEYRTKSEEAILESRAVLLYLPYSTQKRETRVVRLEGDKEIVLMSFGPGRSTKKSELIENYRPDDALTRFGYRYDEEIQCHISPGIR